MASRQAVVTWLLDSDPSIRWQVLRDLTEAPEAVVAAERSRVASEGWAAKLLALQAADGTWGDTQQYGLMPTNDALAMLRELGADPADKQVRKAIDLVRERVAYPQLDNRPFFNGETEACINGRTLASGAYFGAASETLLDQLLSEQLEDGGWNCEAPPSMRSSFHSTICVLDGLLEYENAQGPNTTVTEARLRAQNYLLDRRMLRSLTSGEVIDRRWTRFSFPVIWQYDVLRGLDHLRSAGVKPDERVTEAIDIVKQRQHQNGRWPMNLLHRDRVRIPFDMETTIGAASRWNTLRALRVLDWHDGAEPSRAQP